jgi:uncharacterized protein (UPF0332 family)
MSYREASRQYLKEAQEALRQRHYAQASEKLWGAAAQMVKAIAEEKGWPHNGHALLFQAVNRLVSETGDQEIASLFRGASALHTNFYEQWLPPEDVERAAEDVVRLLRRLESMVEKGR